MLFQKFLNTLRGIVENLRNTDCPPPPPPKKNNKIQSAFGYRLQKNPLWNLKNQTGLWNWLFIYNSVKTPSDLAK